MGLGSIVSGLLGVGGNSGAGDIYRQQAGLYGNIALPELGDKTYEDYQLQGLLDPRSADIVQQGNSNLSTISTDPRLRDAQLGALSSLQDISSSKGLDLNARAKLADVQGQNAAKERGDREAILQNARQRGIGGTGLELAAQLANQQGAATRNNHDSLQVGADAESRALQALQSAGSLGGTIRGQDFSEASTKANAQDVIDKFNAANRQNQYNLNVGAQNQAATTNLANRQAVANQNTGLHNQAYDYNNGGKQQQGFNNQITRAGGQAQAYSGQAQDLMNQKQREDAFTGQLIGAGVSAYAGGKK